MCVLSGKTYQIDNWLTCDNLLELVYKTHSELEGIDLYFNDKMVSETDLREIKEEIIYSLEEPSFLIVFPEE